MNDSLTLRKAHMRDIPALLNLINWYAAKGIMLPRTESELCGDIRAFTVLFESDRLVGCGALQFYTSTMGEIRSLAVAEDLKTQGLGRMLVEALVGEALENSLHAVFAFTYVPEFFRKLGFGEADRGALPLKVWKDCLRCPKFRCCDEIAVIRILQPEAALFSAVEKFNKLSIFTS